MIKEFRCNYSLQYLYDLLESTINNFNFDDDISQRLKELLSYINSIKYKDTLNNDDMDFKEDFYIEVYED